jgi:hypothetical protein
MLTRTTIGTRLCVSLLDNMVKLYEADEGSDAGKAFDTGSVFSVASGMAGADICFVFRFQNAVTRFSPASLKPDCCLNFTADFPCAFFISWVTDPVMTPILFYNLSRLYFGLQRRRNCNTSPNHPIEDTRFVSAIRSCSHFIAESKTQEDECQTSPYAEQLLLWPRVVCTKCYSPGIASLRGRTRFSNRFANLFAYATFP